MQKRTEKHISRYLSSRKRRQKWKILTLILSVLVLCNTLYAMQNAAVAISDKDAELAELQSVVDDALRESAQDDTDVLAITAEFTATSSEDGETQSADEDGTPSDPENAGDPATPGEELPENPADDTNEEQTENGNTGEDVTQTQDDDPATAGDVTLTEDDRTLGVETDLFEDEIDFISALDPAMGLLAIPNRDAQNIDSAYPTVFNITDATGNKVTSVRQNSAVSVEIGWQIGDMSEIAVPGDYLDITLPSELSFPEGTGEFVMSETVRLPDGTVVWAGQIVATFTIKGNNMRVVHTLTAVQLNEAGRLASGIKVGEKEWMRVKIDSVAVKAGSDFNPAITLNGKSLSYGNIAVTAAGPEQIKDVTLNYFYVNGTKDGESVTVGVENPVTIEIGWTWRKLFQYLTSGDWYEIELPEQLHYQAMDDTSTDQKGNVIRIEVTQRTSDNRWVCRVTYVTVQGYYNESSGRIIARGHFINQPVFDSNGRAEETLMAKVSGGTSSLSRTVTLTMGSNVPIGTWHIRGAARYDAYGNPMPNKTYAIYDIETPHQLNVMGGSWNPVLLFVVADHDFPLDKDPFPDVDKVDYEPGYSNYISAYCAEMLRPTPQGSGAKNAQIPTTYDALSLSANTHFTEDAKKLLNNFLPISYPYVSVGEMLSALNFNRSVTEAEAVTAVQLAVWVCEEVGTGPFAWDHVSNWGVDTGNITLIKDLADALLNYKAPQTSSGGTASFEFDGEPNVEWLNETTARVTGRIKGGNVPESVKGTWSNGTISEEVTFTNRATGDFTATLSGVSKSDHFELKFTGKIFGQGRVIYFRDKSKSRQDLISAVSETKDVYFDWYYECTERTVKVIKKWTDEAGRELTTTPDAEIQITLYRQVEGGQREIVRQTGLANPVTLRKGNNFTWTWTNLPMKDANGKPYTYFIEETKVPAGYELAGIETDAEGNGKIIVFTATNKKIEEKTKVTVGKSWEGADGLTKISSRVQLYQTNANDTNRAAVYMTANPPVTTDASGGEIVRADAYTTVPNQAGYTEARWDLSDANSWKVTFDNLPKKDASGNTIRYVVREVSFTVRKNNQLITYYVNADGSTYYIENGVQKEGEFTVSVDQPLMDEDAPEALVRNKRKSGLTVVKHWLDQNGDEWTGTLPPQITVKLGAKKDGRVLTDAELKALLKVNSLELTLTAADSWIGSWSDLPLEGMEYFISEVNTSYTEAGVTHDDFDLYDPLTQQIINGTQVPAVYNAQTGTFEVSLYNRRKSMDIEIIKVDRDDPDKKLAGAVFELYKQSDMNNPVATVTTGTDGVAKFTGLAHNTVYVLKETQAPEGYVDRFNADPVIFRIELIEGRSRVRIISGPDYEKNQVLMTGETLTITVTNQRVTFELPDAGGMGTNGYITGGMSLMFATLLMYITWQFMANRGKGGRKNHSHP